MSQQFQKPLARHPRGPHVRRDDIEAYFVVLRHDDGSRDVWLLTNPMTGTAPTALPELEAVERKDANELLPVERSYPAHAALGVVDRTAERR